MKSVNQTAVVLLAAPFRGGVPGPLALERRGHQDPAPAHAGRAVREPPGLGRLPHGGQNLVEVQCGAVRSGAERCGMGSLVVKGNAVCWLMFHGAAAAYLPPCCRFTAWFCHWTRTLASPRPMGVGATASRQLSLGRAGCGQRQLRPLWCRLRPLPFLRWRRGSHQPVPLRQPSPPLARLPPPTPSCPRSCLLSSRTLQRL